MLEKMDASSIIQFHDSKLANSKWPTTKARPTIQDVWHWIEENHCNNTLLWNEEDKARRTDVGAAEIAASKRLIDKYNQKRNDAVEAIDEAILSQLEGRSRAPDARLNSETAGAMIDRLSILSLKIFHMREQTQRVDASDEHIRTCEAKLHCLMTQRLDLASCFDQLLTDADEGLAYFKVYRQFKMYNDPALNPYLYGKAQQASHRETKL